MLAGHQFYGTFPHDFDFSPHANLSNNYSLKNVQFSHTRAFFFMQPSIKVII